MEHNLADVLFICNIFSYMLFKHTSDRRRNFRIMPVCIWVTSELKNFYFFFAVNIVVSVSDTKATIRSGIFFARIKTISSTKRRVWRRLRPDWPYGVKSTFNRIISKIMSRFQCVTTLSMCSQGLCTWNFNSFTFDVGDVGQISSFALICWSGSRNFANVGSILPNKRVIMPNSRSWPFSWNRCLFFFCIDQMPGDHCNSMRHVYMWICCLLSGIWIHCGTKQ